MSKLRVLHVIGGGEFGGAEQHILNLLTSFPQDALEATVVCFYDSVFSNQLRKAGISVVALDRFGRFDVRLLKALKQTFLTYQPDIIHTHGVKANFFARLAARSITRSLITTVHSNLRYDYGRLAYLVASVMERTTRRWNRHFIAVSEALGEILCEEGVPASRISVIYNGLDLTPLRQTQLRGTDRQHLRQEWQIPADAFLFGTVARFVPVKGLPYLIDAFAQLVRQEPEKTYRLVLVGDGPERALLEEKVKQHGIEDQVCFAGFRHDIPACLHAFDAFVHSSIYEGLGYTIIEAMASEVPVVASNAGGVKEFVKPDQTGLLVEPADVHALADAMKQIATDTSSRAQMVERALEMVEATFTIEQMAEKTLKLYREIVASATPKKQ